MKQKWTINEKLLEKPYQKKLQIICWISWKMLLKAIMERAINSSWIIFPWSERQVQRKFPRKKARSEEHTSELQSRFDLVCRLLLEKKKSIWKSRLEK